MVQLVLSLRISPSSLHPPITQLETARGFPLSLLCSRLKPTLGISFAPALSHHGGPSLNSFHNVNVCLVWGSPALRSHLCWTEENSHFPWCAGYAGSDAAQYVLILHCCRACRWLFLQALQILFGNYFWEGGYEGLPGRGRYLPSRSSHTQQTTILSWVCTFMHLTFPQVINILTC